MIDLLLPQRADNTYRGHKLALWLFGFIVFVKTAIGGGTLFNGRVAAMNADGIPLDTFGAAGAQAFISIFAAWGLSQLMLSAIAILVLVRYRSLVPFMFTLLIFEHVIRRVIFVVLPMPRTGSAPGFWINVALVGIMAVGLILSLLRRREAVSSKQ
jgi:hypothetical protein